MLDFNFPNFPSVSGIASFMTAKRLGDLSFEEVTEVQGFRSPWAKLAHKCEALSYYSPKNRRAFLDRSLYERRVEWVVSHCDKPLPGEAMFSKYAAVLNLMRIVLGLQDGRDVPLAARLNSDAKVRAVIDVVETYRKKNVSSVLKS